MSTQDSVRSPCINICLLNNDDICEGCYRSADEITQWAEFGNEQKQQVLEKAKCRMVELSSHLLL